MQKLFPVLMVLLCLSFGYTPAANLQPFIDSGNTAWVLISTALVMFMTVPALALFYGGLVKRRNVLNVLMQCFVALALISIFWISIGYSLVFSPGKGILAPFIGSLDWAFLNHVGFEPSPYTIAEPLARIPHIGFMIFQCMFAVITPALIIGAFAERMKFSAYMIFIFLWSLVVYAPVAHWVWGSDGWLYKLGTIDFAGGIVVHITAGIAALVTALMIGNRRNLKPTPPHNLTYTMMGAAMLWFGWFGFNAGSALAADGLAFSAFIATNTAGAMATLVWLTLDWILQKKPTMLGVATGAIAGLAAITPGAGFVDVKFAMVIGAVASLICYGFVMFLKPFFKYDDALDAFGVHGVGGIWGVIAAGLFASPLIQSKYKGLIYGNMHLFKIQLFSAGVTILYTLVITWLLYVIIDKLIGMRVTEKAEAIGLDVTQHNERAYTIIE